MRRPSPTLSITRVCFGSPLPLPPLGILTATHPSTPALRLPEGCLRSCSQAQCGPGAATGLAPQAQAPSLASGACRVSRRHLDPALGSLAIRGPSPPPPPSILAAARPSRCLGGPRYGGPQRGSCRPSARPRGAQKRARIGAGPMTALKAPAACISFSP